MVKYNLNSFTRCKEVMDELERFQNPAITNNSTNTKVFIHPPLITLGFGMLQK